MKNKKDNSIAESIISFYFLMLLITIILVMLKYNGSLSIGWIWVLFPLWTPIAFVIIWFIFLSIIILIQTMNEIHRERKERKVRIKDAKK